MYPLDTSTAETMYEQARYYYEGVQGVLEAQDRKKSVSSSGHIIIMP